MNVKFHINSVKKIYTCNIWCFVVSIILLVQCVMSSKCKHYYNPHRAYYNKKASSLLTSCPFEPNSRFLTITGVIYKRPIFINHFLLSIFSKIREEFSHGLDPLRMEQKSETLGCAQNSISKQRLRFQARLQDEQI